MNGTSRPEAARTQHTLQDSPTVGVGMIEVSAGTFALAVLVGSSVPVRPQTERSRLRGRA